MQSVCTHGFVLSPESLSLESLSVNTKINFDSNDENSTAAPNNFVFKEALLNIKKKKILCLVFADCLPPVSK